MFTPWACKRNRRLQNTIAATISLGLGTMKDYWLELLLLFFAFFFITIILCKRFLCIRKRRQKCLLAKIFFTLSIYTHTYIYIGTASPMCGFHAWRNVRILRNRLRSTSGKHASNASVTLYIIFIYIYFQSTGGTKKE